MAKLIISFAIGLTIGGVLIFYFFVGVPRSGQNPERPIQPPDGALADGTAQIVLRQEFFNEVLGAIFRDMNDPAFPLAEGGGQCDSKMTILPEGSGAQTALVFENNRIAAPLAFAGSYNSVVGCLQFTGWAKGYLDLLYDNAGQAVFGQINIETVNLDGVNPIFAGLITPLVQTTLNNRVNPIQIVQARQLVADVPIASTGGTLRANVQDVRAEIKENALNLYVVYSFSGAASPQ